MNRYEIRYRKGEGALSLVVATDCCSKNEAMRMAREFFAPQFSTVEIWEDANRIRIDFERPSLH